MPPDSWEKPFVSVPAPRPRVGSHWRAGTLGLPRPKEPRRARQQVPGPRGPLPTTTPHLQWMTLATGAVWGKAPASLHDGAAPRLGRGRSPSARAAVSPPGQQRTKERPLVSPPASGPRPDSAACPEVADPRGAGAEHARRPKPPRSGPGRTAHSGRLGPRRLTCLMYMFAEGGGGARSGASCRRSARPHRLCPARVLGVTLGLRRLPPLQPPQTPSTAPRSPLTQTKWRRRLPHPGPARTIQHQLEGEMRSRERAPAPSERNTASDSRESNFFQLLKCSWAHLKVLGRREGGRLLLPSPQGSPQRLGKSGYSPWEAGWAPKASVRGAGKVAARGRARGMAGVWPQRGKQRTQPSVLSRGGGRYRCSPRNVN